MRRRKTREIVIKALFAYEIEKGNPYFHLDYIAQDAEMAGYEEGKTLHFLANIEDEFARKLTAGIIDNRVELDEKIDSYTVDWEVKRLGGADRNILRMATYEMLYDNLAPAIVINEAVDLAKLYGSEESPSFINGILDKIAQGIVKP